MLINPGTTRIFSGALFTFNLALVGHQPLPTPTLYASKFGTEIQEYKYFVVLDL
jgi:hypothetical protein